MLGGKEKKLSRLTSETAVSKKEDVRLWVVFGEA